MATTDTLPDDAVIEDTLPADAVIEDTLPSDAVVEEAPKPHGAKMAEGPVPPVKLTMPNGNVKPGRYQVVHHEVKPVDPVMYATNPIGAVGAAVMREGVNTVQDYLTPVIHKVQDTIGKPVVDTMIDAGKKHGMSTATEYLDRGGTEWLSGQAVEDSMSPEDRLKAVNQIEDFMNRPEVKWLHTTYKRDPETGKINKKEHPVEASALVEAEARGLGKLPLYMATFGRLSSLKELPLAETMAEGAITNAGAQLLDVTPEVGELGARLDSVPQASDAAQTGALFGAGIHGAGQTLKVIGMSGDAARQFADLVDKQFGKQKTQDITNTSLGFIKAISDAHEAERAAQASLLQSTEQARTTAWKNTKASEARNAERVKGIAPTKVAMGEATIPGNKVQDIHPNDKNWKAGAVVIGVDGATAVQIRNGVTQVMRLPLKNRQDAKRIAALAIRSKVGVIATTEATKAYANDKVLRGVLRDTIPQEIHRINADKELGDKARFPEERTGSKVIYPAKPKNPKVEQLSEDLVDTDPHNVYTTDAGHHVLKIRDDGTYGINQLTSPQLREEAIINRRYVKLRDPVSDEIVYARSVPNPTYGMGKEVIKAPKAEATPGGDTQPMAAKPGGKWSLIPLDPSEGLPTIGQSITDIGSVKGLDVVTDKEAHALAQPEPEDVARYRRANTTARPHTTYDELNATFQEWLKRRQGVYKDVTGKLKRGGAEAAAADFGTSPELARAMLKQGGGKSTPAKEAAVARVREASKLPDVIGVTPEHPSEMVMPEGPEPMPEEATPLPYASVEEFRTDLAHAHQQYGDKPDEYDTVLKGLLAKANASELDPVELQRVMQEVETAPKEAMRTVVNGPSEAVPPKPPPPPPPNVPPEPPPGTPPVPSQPGSVGAAMDTMTPSQWQRVKAWFDMNVKRKVFHSTSVGPVEQTIDAIKATGANRIGPGLDKAVYERLARIGKGKPFEVDRDLGLVFNGKMGMDEFITKHNLTQDVENLVNKYRELADANDAELRARGYLGGMETLDELGDEALRKYATRTYLKYLLGKTRWAEIARKDEVLMRDLTKWVNENIHPDEDVTQPEHIKAFRDAWIADMLGDGASWSDPKHTPQGGSGMAQAKKSMMGRATWPHTVKTGDTLESLAKDWDTNVEAIKALNPMAKAIGTLPAGMKLEMPTLPPIVRRALGETQSGAAIIAATISRQEALLLQAKVLDSVWAMGPVQGVIGPDTAFIPASFGGPPADPLHKWLPVPPNQRLYGKGAGGWLRDDWHDSVITAPNMQAGAHRTLQMLQGILKADQATMALGGPGVAANNMLGLIRSGIESGGLDIATDDAAAFRGLRDALKAQREWKEGPKLGLTPHSSLYDTMLAHHVVSAGFHAQEMNGLRDGIQKQVEAHAKGMVKPRATDLIASIFRTVTTPTRKAGELDDYMANLFKAASWLSIRERGLKDPKFMLGAQWQEGMSPQTITRLVEEEASRRIHRSFPQYDAVSPLNQKLRTAAPFVMDPYITFKSERNRILALYPWRVANEPGFGSRLAKYSLFLANAALYTAIARRHNGIQQSEVDAAFQNMPMNQYRPGWMALWYRTPDGKAVVGYDLTSHFDELRMASGGASPLVNVAYNEAKTAVGLGGGVAGNLIDQALSGFHGSPALPQYTQPMNTMGGVLDVASRAGAMPGAIQSIPKALSQGGMFGTPNRMQPMLSPGNAASNAFGGTKFVPGGTPMQGAVMGISKGMSDVSAAKAGMRMAPNQFLGTAQFIQSGGDTKKTMIQNAKDKLKTDMQDFRNRKK